MPNKNSDFKREFSDLFELLPEVLKSQTNESVFNNVINRFLSKPEIERANGLVGNIPEPLRNRQIQEPTPHRQAFQLQPLLSTRIGGENFTSSYVDVLNELERLGVDPCRQKIWGSAPVFNWVPPVDIDKLINYRDYFWVDPIDPSSPQQYITIENRCAKAEELVAGYQQTLNTFGEDFNIVALDSSENTITVASTQDLSAVFTAGFTFYVRGSSNLDINDTFFTTTSSAYDGVGQTTITVADDITIDTPADGVASLVESFSVLQAQRNCACSGDIGWSQGPWDSNDIGNIFGLGGLLSRIEAASEADWISMSPEAPADDNDLWYDTTNDELKQYTAGSFVTVVSNFSALKDFVETTFGDFGNLNWDSSDQCETTTNQWVDQNRWLHRNAVTNIANARQATQPIIEYSAQLQLNEWNFVDFVWKYRESDFLDFEDTTAQPTLNELYPFPYVITSGTEVQLSTELGDQTSTFVPGHEFVVYDDPDNVANEGVYTVVSSSFANGVTTITTAETFAATTTAPQTTGRIRPENTSQGDVFRTYDEHWVLVNTTDSVAVTPRPANPNLEIDPTTTPTPAPGIGEYLLGPTVDATDFGGSVYAYVMEYFVSNPGGVLAGTTFPLDATMTQRALVGENDIRVYVDNVRQYGQYVEVDTGGFVSGIQFDNDIPENVVVRIAVGEAALEGIGKHNVPVRTIEDDAQFGVSGPEQLSLINYRRSEQVKNAVNQYPLFDVVNVDGTDTFTANHIFGYQTSSDAPINARTGLRIVVGPDQDFGFEQLILEEDNGKMYAFILNGNVQTIWREGNNNEQYVPEYVNSVREPVPVGDPDGFWEIPDQLYFNSEHENRQVVTYRELFTHFTSIIRAQPNVPGVIVPGNTFYLQLDPNFGLGGTIKEHNFSYDTLLSSTFIDNVTPLGVIDFAHDQYLNSLNTLKELYRDNLVTYLTNTSPDFIQDFGGSIADDVVSRYELNDYLSLIFGDANTYDAETDSGVRNWPATLPYIRMAFARRPTLIEDEARGIFQLTHHDGHRSSPGLTAATTERIIQVTLNTSDTRVTPAEPFGQQSTSPPPSTFGDLQLTTTPRSGIYWYEVVGSNRTLYRFNVVAVSAVPPVDVEPGALWYDTDTDTLRELSATLSWNPVTAVGDGLIDDAWEETNLDQILADLLFNIETRLYDHAPDLDQLAFDVDTLPSAALSCPDISTTVTEADTFNLYLQQAFASWLRDQEIADPYSSAEYYNAVDPFTWNYKQSTINTYPRVGQTSGDGGWWEDLYNTLYGTPYPHLEPWKLQGYQEKPDWWDTQYLDTSGTRRWIYDHGTTTGMWENIRTGVVPVGFDLPDGTASTGAVGEVAEYNYFSVNIDDVPLAGVDPDGILPPFWDFVANGGSASVRSVFETFGLVVTPSADYQFGDRGPVEFEWTQTAQRLYDDLTIAFRMEPVRFFHSTFGEEFIDVAGLNVNAELCKVYSHKDVRFHGDIHNINELLQFQGLNQWYVNFNRASGFDTVSSNFRPLWTNWNPLLAYQFGSVIDTDTFQISSPNFDVNARDYRILLKDSPGIENLSYDGLKVSVLRVPNRLIAQDTESLWTFQVDTFAPEASPLEYYNVRNYPVYADTITNSFTLYRFPIVDINQIGGVFTIAGNQVEAFTESNAFTIANSTGNNGSYVATNVVYDSVNNVTLVSVSGMLPDPTVDGTLTASYRTHPWQTGDAIEMTSTIGLPSPLVADTTYYVIRLSGTRFQLASSATNAQQRIPIDIRSVGRGVIKAGQVSYKFIAGTGEATDREWIHYVLDRDSVLTLPPPSNVYGVQNLINFVDGYAEREKEEGFVFNYEGTETDLQLNRPVSWETEQERFLDSIFRLRSFRQSQPERYNIAVDVLSDELEFSSTVPSWVTGQAVQIGALNGTVPTPLLPNTPYYLVATENSNRVQLATTRTNALLGNAIDILAGGVGDLYLTEYRRGRYTIETFEINPARNNLWVQTPQGILSDISTGSTADLRGLQLITDQNGNQLTTEELAVFRLDKLSRIVVQERKPNPRKPTAGQDPLRDFVHMSAASLFIDGTEHVLLFNDDSVEGLLIYDPFLGLNTSRFELLYFRQDEYTQRPVVGGYYLTPDAELRRNIESATLDLQTAYDTYQVLETTDLTKEARRSIGYPGVNDQDYLTDLNLSPKSQFAFWRGFIPTKGSTIGIDAYVNSRTFAGASVDEVWAFKVADFGSPREQEYPELLLTEQDGQRVEKRFEFLDPTMDRFEADATFEGVFTTDQPRWNNQPNQQAALSDNFNALFFRAEVTDVKTFTGAADGNVRVTPTGQYAVQFEARRFPVTETLVSDQWTLTGEDPLWQTGKRIHFDTSTATTVLPGGLVPHRDYFVIRVSPSVIRVANSRADAFAGNFIDLGGTGTLSGSAFMYDPEQDQPVFFDRVEILRVNTVAETAVQLTDGVDYTTLNSQVVLFGADPAGSLAANEEYRMYAINPAKDIHNTPKIIDIQDDIVISEAPLWDPRRGSHYAFGENVVTIESDFDPAVYSNSPDATLIEQRPWREPQVGEVWWDTSQRGYVPYHDRNVFSLERRSQSWGRLAQWADNRLYQWTESDVPPAEWDEEAAIEGVDITIDPRVRKSGTAKVDVFRRERSTIEVDQAIPSTDSTLPNRILIDAAQGADLTVGDRIVFASTNTLPSPLEERTFYYVTSIGGVIGSSLPITVSLTPGGSTVEIDPGALVFDISGAASNVANPTHLLNDFGSNGFQAAQYTVALTSTTPTTYLTGTNGTATVNLTPAQALANTPYALGDYGTGASVFIPDSSATSGSAVVASFGGGGAIRVTEIEVDGLTANFRYQSTTAPYTYGELINEIQTQVNSQLSSSGKTVTVSLTSTPSTGILITSNDAVPGGYVNTTTEETGASSVVNLWRDILGLNQQATVITVPQAGAPVAEKSGVITFDAVNILPVSITADQAETYDDLIDQINQQIGDFGTASLVAGNLVVTSDLSTGTTSTVTLAGDIFTDLVAFTSFSTLAGTSSVYGAEVTVNGSNIQTVTFNGEDAPTIGDLLGILNSQLSGVNVDIDGNDIVVASATIGVNSSIVINDVVGGTLPVFGSIPNFSSFGPSVIGTEQQQYSVDVITEGQVQNVIVTGNQVQTYNELINEINADLSNAEIVVDLNGNLRIENGSEQVSIDNDELFQYLSTAPTTNEPPIPPATPAVVDIFNVDTGIGNHVVAPSFQDNWVQLQRIIVDLVDGRDGSTSGSNRVYNVARGVFPNSIADGDTVSIYRNGTLYGSAVVASSSVTIPAADVSTADFITVVKDIEPVTDEEAGFDPEVNDDGDVLVQRKEDYNFSVRDVVNEFEETEQRYYFWVENKTTRTGDNPSLINAVAGLTTIPTPFVVLDKRVDRDVSAGGDPLSGVPERYTQAILKGLSTIINDDNRYIMRFVKDLTLRDDLQTRDFPSDLPADFTEVGSRPLDLKTLHEEWTLYREGQSFKIPRSLWDKITEAVIGRKLDNPAIRVPSLNRELYDAQFNAQTQYGFDEGQAFVNGQLALATVLDDLEDPNNDFSPVDINSFFLTNETETEAGLVAFFDTIYNSFPVEAVNRIYFKVLLDALSTKDKYPGVFKTSWVALEGRQRLQTEDLING